MTSVQRVSVVGQAANLLREGISAGRWKKHLPGLRKLGEELDVSRESLRPALAQLAEEGLLRQGGPNEPHEIIARKSKAPVSNQPRSLRVAVLLIQPLALADGPNQRAISHIVSLLQGDGHTCVMVSPPANRDTHKPGFLSRLVAETAADAWLVQIGTREVLEWFIASKLPTMALGGACMSLPIAGTGVDSAPALRESVQRLLALGHRRIVYISPDFARHPEPGRTIRTFRETLQEAGIQPSEYHIPEWDESPQGLEALLDSLFRVTPPTALVCWNMKTAMGSISYLARRGLRIPQDVSVVSTQNDPDAVWIFPDLKVAQFEDDESLFYRRIRQWVQSAAMGKPHTTQFFNGSRFIEGNTIGPARQC